MSRQLNSEIFSENFSVTQTSLPLLDGDRLDTRYEDVSQRLDKVRFEIQEWVKSVNLRLEKALQRVQTLEDRARATIQDTHEKMATLYSKFKENQNSDLKFAALIERHNQIVQSFELRLSQSQRLIDNQSVQLAKQQELIDDARRQLEKLKRL